MRHYLESTVALHSSLYSSTHPVESLSVRDTLAQTWPNDPPILDKDSILSRAQVHINQIRNSVLLVNKLPLELLLKIFRFAAFLSPEPQSSTPPRDDYKDLLVLTQVCSSWRKTLLSTPSFWSRFELYNRNSIGVECERAQMYSDRARGASQSLFIEEAISHYFRSGGFDMILKIIQPRLDDLTQLALLKFPEIRYVTQAIQCWLKHGKTGVLRTLTIHMESDIQLEESIPTRNAEIFEKASSILGSVRSLSLRGVKFDWDSPVYHNLVQLQIGNIPYEASPSIHIMLDVLSTSPLLRTLAISNMAILRGDQVPVQPIYLTELQNLDLVGLTYESLDVLLPMITPESKDLSLRITLLSLEDHLISAVRSFLKRTSVTRLFIQQDLMAQCLPVVPNLRALVVDLQEQPGDSCFFEFSYIEESSARRILRCPKLHTLHLHSGSVPIEAMQGVVQTHPLIQKLRFSACYVDPFEDELSYWLKPHVEDVQFNLRLHDTDIVDWSSLMV